MKAELKTQDQIVKSDPNKSEILPSTRINGKKNKSNNGAMLGGGEIGKQLVMHQVEA